MIQWEEVSLQSENDKVEPFALIGCGRIKLSKGACALIKDFDKCNYVSFVRAKRYRLVFIGIKFQREKTDNAIKFEKIENDTIGAVIRNEKLFHTFYGEEGISRKYSKRVVDLERDNPNILVIFHKFLANYYPSDNPNYKLRRKHIGTIIDNEWKVMRSYTKINSNGNKTPMYIINNINTNEEMEISTRALNDIVKGYTTVSNIKYAREIGVASYLGKRRREKQKKIKDLH